MIQFHCKNELFSLLAVIQGVAGKLADLDWTPMSGRLQKRVSLERGDPDVLFPHKPVVFMHWTKK